MKFYNSKNRKKSSSKKSDFLTFEERPKILKFSQKSKFVFENSNFLEKSNFFCQKYNFFVKNTIFSQKSIFYLSKIQMFVKNQNFC